MIVDFGHRLLCAAESEPTVAGILEKIAALEEYLDEYSQQEQELRRLLKQAKRHYGRENSKVGWIALRTKGPVIQPRDKPWRKDRRTMGASNRFESCQDMQ